MITFKEMVDRRPPRQGAEDLEAQTAMEAHQLQAANSGKPSAAATDEEMENLRNKMDSMARRRTTIRQHKRDKHLVKMKVIDVHDAILYQ